LSYVSIAKPVKDRIVQAARETPTEIIGLLLGRLQDDTIIIEDSTTHEFSSEPHRVMLPPTSIAVIADQLLSGQLKGNIVGWYHSHTEGGLFYSETDIATQKRLQQFSSLVTGLVVDSSTGEVGYFRVVPGTNQAVRLRDSNVTVFTDPAQAVPERHPVQQAVAPTPTVEVRRRPPRATAINRRMVLSIVIIVLIVSVGVFAAVLYKYSTLTAQPPVTIMLQPVSTATIGTPVEILTNVTGPARNVTLVYGQTNGVQITDVLMNPIASGEYNFYIPANQVTGNIAYFVKAYDPAGRQVNTTVYHIPVADFSLQAQVQALTVYRTKSVSFQLQLVPINNFDDQVQLSTSGNPSGLTVSFSTNHATPGNPVALNVTANQNVPNGTYSVALLGTYSPPQSSEVNRQSIIEVTVADFQVAVTPATVAIQPGSSAAFKITLTIQKGFTSPVSLTEISGLPTGSTYSVTSGNSTILANGPSSTHITLQIKTLNLTKAGTYPIVIVISGGGLIHDVPAQIIVR
jgi:proteasome lid subunit RPN8/RPN11